MVDRRTQEKLAGVLFYVGVALAAGFVLILYVAVLFGPPIEAEEKETTVETTVERTVEVPVERTVEVESAESKAAKAEKRAESDRNVEEMRQKESGDGFEDFPDFDLPNPDLPNIPGSHCVGRGIFRVCV